MTNPNPFHNAPSLLGLSLGVVNLKLVASDAAKIQKGTRPETIARTWKERLTTFPWRPWVATKIIQVPNYEPAIFQVGNIIYYHPSLEEKIKQIMK